MLLADQRRVHILDASTTRRSSNQNSCSKSRRTTSNGVNLGFLPPLQSLVQSLWRRSLNICGVDHRLIPVAYPSEWRSVHDKVSRRQLQADNSLMPKCLPPKRSNRAHQHGLGCFCTSQAGHKMRREERKKRAARLLGTSGLGITRRWSHRLPGAPEKDENFTSP